MLARSEPALPRLHLLGQIQSQQRSERVFFRDVWRPPVRARYLGLERGVGVVQPLRAVYRISRLSVKKTGPLAIPAGLELG